MFALSRSIGWIEVITGPMFSGKSEELIRRLNRAQLARQRIIVFKPVIDNRYHSEDIVSHSRLRITAIPIENASDILKFVEVGTQVVGIDEGQFFGPELVEICDQLADRGVRVIVAGLDQDYRGKPFGPIPQLLAIAESVTKLKAVCMRCGAPASRSQRLLKHSEQVVIGSAETYEARCRLCFERPEEEPKQSESVGKKSPQERESENSQADEFEYEGADVRA